MFRSPTCTLQDKMAAGALALIADISIEEFARENDRIKYIRFSRNFGRESGILAGFKYASGDAVMVMDGDLQHPPYLIPLFLEAYNEGYDIVSGQRTREGESFVGSSFARLFYFLSNRSMDVHLTDGKSELRLLSRKAMEAFVSMPEYNRFNKGLYEWIGSVEELSFGRFDTCGQ